ncbi:hypothetical protein [Pontibacillus marinus]|uniref:Uncharacterized protein n=1 Tax=Pontibacillus marinus BH030004 = DSM 16465 TaxID=1385511 RepID=A0A0A5FQX5_9BACI|nr:hypothetical protein [Pontibacillus marinus]KGX83181.1 hypothetical protein N783_05850 [Pontibacillus marinus BH030004 = DSM 16465]
MEVFLILLPLLSGLIGFFLGGPLGILIGAIFGCLFYISMLLTKLWFIVEEKQLEKEWEKKIYDIE